MIRDDTPEAVRFASALISLHIPCLLKVDDSQRSLETGGGVWGLGYREIQCTNNGARAAFAVLN